jgi:hypothetical protein
MQWYGGVSFKTAPQTLDARRFHHQPDDAVEFAPQIRITSISVRKGQTILCW